MTRNRGKRLIATAAGLALASQVAAAASIDWDNETADGKWNTTTNWSTNITPTGGDDAAVIHPVAGPANITADIPVLRDIRFGDDNRPGSGVVNHSAGTATLNGWFRMGIATGSGGTYNLSGGLIETGRYNVAESNGATGTVAVTGGTLRQRDTADIANADNWNRIGQDGVATFNLSNGTVSLDARTLIGAAPTSQGNVVTQTGGVFEVRRGELVIGDQGQTTYNISGGTLRTLNADNGNADTSGNLTVGQWDNSNGTLNVSGNATVLVAANLNIGNGQAGPVSTGTVTQTGGIVRVGTAGNGNLSLSEQAAG